MTIIQILLRINYCTSSTVAMQDTSYGASPAFSYLTAIVGNYYANGNCVRIGSAISFARLPTPGPV